MISVVIPSYNREKTIERSVRSVLAQSVDELEVIVVDDCSNDGTEQVINGIGDDRVRFIRLETRSGACVARNRGVQEARGDIIAFQDSDDEWHEDKLQVQVSALEATGADICFCSLRRHYLGDDARVIVWPESLSGEDRFVDHVTLRRTSCVSTQTIVARRPVFDTCRFDPKVVKSQDWDWVIRASMEYSVYFVARPLVDQYLQTDSISMGYERFIQSRIYFLEKYDDICQEDVEFKLHLLQQLAHYKTLGGINASKEYGEIYKQRKNLHTFLCKLLSDLHLMERFRKGR